MRVPLSFKVKNRTVNFNYIPNLQLRRRRVFDELDATHFQALVVFVAGAGFFTDGYDIFAVGIIIPMLAHVYWHGAMPVPLEMAMRTATLAGTILGQFAFGVLADLYGRRKMYGLELLIVIVATVGVAMAADGASNSMSLVGWLISWRFLMGLGIGGGYPLSAVITSEFAPTRSRARMLATVFYMQPCGYLAATLVSIVALVGNRHRIPTSIPTDLRSVKSCTNDEMCRRAVDSIWRWVIGVGAIPAAIAIFFRFTIPESPRYTMEVLNRPDEALEDVNEMAWQGSNTNGNPRDMEMQRRRSGNRVVRDRNTTVSTAPDSPQPPRDSGSIAPPPNDHTMRDSVSLSEAMRPSSSVGSMIAVEQPSGAPGSNDIADDYEKSRWKRFRTGFSQHFFSQGHWPTLLGTSLAWASFDFAFYALGPNSYKVVAKIFNETPLHFTQPPKEIPSRSIYMDLFHSAWHSLIIVSIGSMTGGLAMIGLIKKVSPRTIQLFGFLILTALFIAIGICFQLVERTSSVPLLVCLYILSEIFFEVGPNFTTFIIPAELFPTQFRCTSHGISAASGKIAAVLVQVFVTYAPIGPYHVYQPSTQWLGYVIIIFAGFMFAGAAVTKWLIPETRESDGCSRPLEQLADAARILRPTSRTRSRNADPTLPPPLPPPASFPPSDITAVNGNEGIPPP